MIVFKTAETNEYLCIVLKHFADDSAGSGHYDDSVTRTVTRC